MPAIDTREHVAHAGDGHARVAAVADASDAGRAARRSSPRPSARPCRRSAPAASRRAEAVALHGSVRRAEQARRLARMRRQDPVSRDCGVSGEQIQRVRVDDERLAGRQRRREDFHCPRRLAQARARAQ